MNSSILCVKHIPDGFYEKAMYGYFKQFGTIVRVRIPRSKKGYVRGVAFIEFKNVEVAEVAAETMDNYILGDKRLRCKVLKVGKTPKRIKYGKLFAKYNKPHEAKIRHTKLKNKTIKNPENVKKQMYNFVKKFSLRLKKIQESGIDYSYDFKPKWNIQKEKL